MSTTEVLVRQKAQAAHDAAGRRGTIRSGQKNKAPTPSGDAVLG